MDSKVSKIKQAEKEEQARKIAAEKEKIEIDGRQQVIAENHEHEREQFEQKLEKTKEAAAAKAAESQKKLAADMEHEAAERQAKRDGAKKEAMDELQKIESNLDKADAK